MNLDDVTVDDMLNELKKRYRGVLIVTEQADKVDDEIFVTSMAYAGGANTAIGLAHRAIKTLDTILDE